MDAINMRDCYNFIYVVLFWKDIIEICSSYHNIILMLKNGESIWLLYIMFHLPAIGLFVEHVFHGVTHCAANYHRYHGARVALNVSFNLNEICDIWNKAIKFEKWNKAQLNILGIYYLRILQFKGRKWENNAYV